MYQVYETQIVYYTGKYDNTIILLSEICEIEGLDPMTYDEMVQRYGEPMAKFYIDEALQLLRKEGKIR